MATMDIKDAGIVTSFVFCPSGALVEGYLYTNSIEIDPWYSHTRTHS